MRGRRRRWSALLRVAAVTALFLALPGSTFAGSGCREQLAYSHGRIELVDLATKKIQSVTSPARRFYDDTPAWSPDGSRLAFARTRRNDQSFFYNADVYIIDATGAHERLRGGFESNPVWSPDGRRLLMATTGGHDSYASIVIADGVGRPKVFSYMVSGGEATWLTAGQLAYAWDQGGLPRPPSGLYVTSDGKHSSLIVRGVFNRPTSSPDGRYVVVTRHDDELALVDVRQRTIRNTLGRTHSGVAWSPDSRELAYADEDRGSIVVESSGGRRIRELAVGKNPEAPQWSPDGRWISYLVFAGALKGSSLYVVPASGGVGRRVVRTAVSSSAWRPCG